jgi:hypothetical protein
MWPFKGTEKINVTDKRTAIFNLIPDETFIPTPEPEIPTFEALKAKNKIKEDAWMEEWMEDWRKKFRRETAEELVNYSWSKKILEVQCAFASVENMEPILKELAEKGYNIEFKVGGIGMLRIYLEEQ